MFENVLQVTFCINYYTYLLIYILNSGDNNVDENNGNTVVHAQLDCYPLLQDQRQNFVTTSADVFVPGMIGSKKSRN